LTITYGYVEQESEAVAFTSSKYSPDSQVFAGAGKMATALLVIDMQNVFHSMVRSSLAQVLTLISAFERASLPIIFTQHGHTSDELSGAAPNQLVRLWGAAGCIASGSTDWEFMPEIERHISQGRVLAKNTYDAFVNTGLEKVLRDELRASRVVICGVMSDHCCQTTGIAAFNRGFQTWYVRDACGSASEEQHMEGVRSFEKLCGNSMTADEVVGTLGIGDSSV